MNRCRHFLPVAVLTVLTLAVPPAAAQYTWTGAGTTSWNRTFNWSPQRFSEFADAPRQRLPARASARSIIDSLSVRPSRYLFTTPRATTRSPPSAGQTLSGVNSITVDAAVTGVETINLANISTGVCYSRPAAT